MGLTERRNFAVGMESTIFANWDAELALDRRSRRPG